LKDTARQWEARLRTLDEKIRISENENALLEG